jgi:hypothetical protein
MSRDTPEARQPSRKTRSEPQGAVSGKEYPVREYIGAMCLELAQMARWDGDERLAILLETAAARSNEARPERSNIETLDRIARSA